MYIAQWLRNGTPDVNNCADFDVGCVVYGAPVLDEYGIVLRAKANYFVCWRAKSNVSPPPGDISSRGKHLTQFTSKPLLLDH